MKRDMNLVRKILLFVEDRDSNDYYSDVEVNGYEAKIINYHIVLLEEAGLIKANYQELNDGSFNIMVVKRLTWEGHEFLSAAKSDKIWNEAAKVVKQKGIDLPIKVFQSLLESLIKSAIFS